MAKDIPTKTEKARSFLLSGDYKSCLRILKTFRVGITKAEKRTIEIAYECLSGKDGFYSQLGFNTSQEIEKGKEIAMCYFKMQ